METTTRKLAIAILAFSMLAVPLFGYAQTNGAGHCDRGQGFGPGARHFDAMADDLGLTLEQAALLETMKTTHREFAEAEFGDVEPETRGNRRGMHRERLMLMRPFRDAMLSDNPDFQNAGEALKAGYTGNNKALFDAMVDAHVAFHASLTDEQLETLRENRPRHRFGHGRGGRNTTE